jgi:3-mercaptopyruvate sulfurtransferase SseA
MWMRQPVRKTNVVALQNAPVFEKNGFSNVNVIDGGIPAWVDQGT